MSTRKQGYILSICHNCSNYLKAVQLNTRVCLHEYTTSKFVNSNSRCFKFYSIFYAIKNQVFLQKA